jgi:polygalacturonase
VPAGEFVTGAIHLKSNVNLHVTSGGLIRFSTDPGKYPVVLTRFEGVELMNYSPFIYALDQENIAITGEGTIDGGADSSHWWDWKSQTRSESDSPNDRDALFQMAEKSVPVAQRVFGPGHYLRPQFMQPYRCKNVLIEGVTLLNSPMWNVHPVLCSNVTVRKLTLNSSGPNTDGCDPESCSDVLIDDCTFSTGDDCIAVKSGRNADGRRIGVPSENIIVRNCRMKNGHGGVTVGSEITGGMNNLFVENCAMDSPKLDMAFRVKNNAMRGGLLHDLHLRDIKVGEVAHSAISIDFFYEEGKAGAFTPVARDISVNKLSTQKAEYALYLRGFEKMPIENVAIVNCDFHGIGRPSVIENVRGLNLRRVYINGKLADLPE